MRTSARLRCTLSAQQLTTIRYEELVSKPETAAGMVSGFVGADVPAAALRDAVPQAAPEPGAWRRALSAEQAAEVDKIAGDELRRVGYGGGR